MLLVTQYIVIILRLHDVTIYTYMCPITLQHLDVKDMGKNFDDTLLLELDQKFRKTSVVNIDVFNRGCRNW